MGLEATAQNPGSQGTFSFKLTTAYFKETIVIPTQCPRVSRRRWCTLLTWNFKMGKLPPRKALEEEAFNATVIVH